MDRRIKINYLYSISYQLLTLVTPLITIPYVSRVFGAEYLGIYSYTNTIAQYFVLFAMLGLSNYGNRAIAIARENKEVLSQTFCDIYTMQIATGVCSLVIYIVYAIFFSKEFRIYSCILSLYVLSSVFDISWLFFGLEKFKLTVTRNFFIKIVSVVCILLLVKSKDDLWLYTLIFALSSLLSVIVLWPYAKNEVKFIKPSYQRIKAHIRPNLVMFIPVIAISIYKYMDKLMLGNASKIEVGYYDNVEKIYTIVMGFITSFGSVMLPRMSNMAGKASDKNIKDTIAISMRFVIGLSTALAFGIVAVAEVFVGVYYGPGFEACKNIMVFMAPTVLFQAWANVVRTQYLIPFKKDFVYVVSVISGAIVNFAINWLLIPKLGAIGAVIGTVASEVIVAIFQTIASNSFLQYPRYVKECAPYFVFGCIMVIVIRFLNSIISLPSILTLITDIIVGGAVYLLMWFLYWKYMNKRGA